MSSSSGISKTISSASAAAAGTSFFFSGGGGIQYNGFLTMPVDFLFGDAALAPEVPAHRSGRVHLDSFGHKFRRAPDQVPALLKVFCWSRQFEFIDVSGRGQLVLGMGVAAAPSRDGLKPLGQDVSFAALLPVFPGVWVTIK